MSETIRINGRLDPRRLGLLIGVAAVLLASTGCTPDVTSQDGMQFGAKAVAWGGAVELTVGDAFLVSDGKCAFDIEYDMVNVGKRMAEPAFWNRVRSAGDVITQQSNLTLATGEKRIVKTQGYLAPGNQTLSLTLDDENDVAEGNESNNSFSVDVNLIGPCVELADITAKDTITIGGKSATWGGSIQLDNNDAFLVSNGKCAFRVSYDMVNGGSLATSPPFWNRTRASGKVVTQQSNLELAAGEERNILTDAYIDAGSHTVELSLDDDSQVPESDEGNNKFSLTVTVGGVCS